MVLCLKVWESRSLPGIKLKIKIIARYIKLKIAIIVQARLNSKRLPGKVLLKINNRTILEHVYFNLQKINNINKIIVATSKNKSDDLISAFCKRKKIELFRGNLNDVYKRLTLAAKYYDVDYIVRVSADSPLINHKIIEDAINNIDLSKYDIITNVLPRSFPKGQSFEIINCRFLENNYNRIKNKSDKEHVTTFFYRNYKKFKIFNILNKNKDLSNYNFCVDTKGDLARIMFIMKKMKNLSLNNLIKNYEDFKKR